MAGRTELGSAEVVAGLYCWMGLWMLLKLAMSRQPLAALELPLVVVVAAAVEWPLLLEVLRIEGWR